MTRSALPCPVCRRTIACTPAETREHVEKRHPEHVWTRRDDATLTATRHAEYVLDGVDLLNEERFTWLYMAVVQEQNRREREADPDAPWDPWTEIRRRPYLDLEWVWFDDAFGGRGLFEGIDGGRRRRISIDVRLNCDQRRWTLAHELVHDERGGGVIAHGLTEAEHDYLTAVDEADVELEVERRIGVDPPPRL